MWGITGWVNLKGLAIFLSCPCSELPFWTVYIFRQGSEGCPTFWTCYGPLGQGCCYLRARAVSAVKQLGFFIFQLKIDSLLLCSGWSLRSFHLPPAGHPRWRQEVLLVTPYTDLDALQVVWYFHKLSLNTSSLLHELHRGEDGGGEGRFQLPS